MNKGKEVLLDSEVDAPFRHEWPKNIRNIIVVPLCSKNKTRPSQQAGPRQSGANRIIGMLVAVNRLDKPDFDSTDAKLFTSVASECAVFVENNRLFGDLKELFIGSLKALTRSIDAKTATHAAIPKESPSFPSGLPNNLPKTKTSTRSKSTKFILPAFSTISAKSA